MDVARRDEGLTQPHIPTILVLNSGSSSLKFGLFRPGESDESPVLEGSAEGIGTPGGSLHIRSSDGAELLSREHLLETQSDALGKIAKALDQHRHTVPVAVGHRVVHGGPSLREHQRITPSVIDALRAATHFAPLHIPQALKLVIEAQQIFPSAQHFACFDTAFHRTMPEIAARLPLPQRYFEQGVRRYGFHGLSYESIVHRLREDLPHRAVFAHLGNGSSLVAVIDGQSIDTSMGLTPTGGVPMGTRSGDLDPGVLLYLMRKESLDADALEALVNHQCGLAGYSGGESDMQLLLKRAGSHDHAAAVAIDAFTTAVKKYIGAYAARMGGLDLLVFTGGIGEHSSEIRRRVCDGLDFLGLSDAPNKIRVMHAEEELQIARHCRALMSSPVT